MKWDRAGWVALHTGLLEGFRLLLASDISAVATMVVVVVAVLVVGEGRGGGWGGEGRSGEERRGAGPAEGKRVLLPVSGGGGTGKAGTECEVRGARDEV